MYPLDQVRILCTETEGHRGIWKRIDENRELLAFLQEQAPDLLERFGFIEIWIGNNDIFFMNLLKLLGIADSPPWAGNRFPRKWPGDPVIEKAYLDFSPEIAKRIFNKTAKRRRLCARRHRGFGSHGLTSQPPELLKRGALLREH